MSKDSKEIHKSHNVTVLLYHVVCAIKYRRIVIDEDVDLVICDVCSEIELRYDIYFLEVGTDLDHIHFLIQSVPDYSVTKIVRTVKSILAREVFRQCPQIKEKLWGGEFFGKGYYTNTVGQHGTENMIANYVKKQGKQEEYRQLKVGEEQLKLF